MNKTLVVGLVILMMALGALVYLRVWDTGPSMKEVGDTIVISNVPPPTPSTKDSDVSRFLASKSVGIIGGKVTVSNMGVGKRAEGSLVIHNGGSEPLPFSVRYTDYFAVADGYVMPPPSARSWITISKSDVVVSPGGNEVVDVVLDIPKDAKGIPKKWEFRVTIRDTSQTGNIRTEVAQRWLVEMR